MNYDEAIQLITSKDNFYIDLGLDRIRSALKKLENPQNNLKFIHVAGTNGKGSTCTICANILREARYKVGLYTSPYVVDFRERIQINGEMIPEDNLANCVSAVKNIVDKFCIEPTEFEFITAVAFLYFSMQNCDYVVLEVGLGGRFDATNVIPAPEACVITSVSLDHTSVLGDTIKKIAFEKCGIIKPGSKVIVYPKQREDALSVILDTCAGYNIKPVIPDSKSVEFGGSDIYGTEFRYKGMDFLLPLAGEHMVYNAITAIETVKCILSGISENAVIAGVNNTIMPARLELISDRPVVILDGGHNEDCAIALERFIKAKLEGKKITAVCSIMADKDYKKYLEHVIPYIDELIACRANVPRALDEALLVEEASNNCSNIHSVRDALSAVKIATENVNEDEALIVCGSFYFAGEVRNYLKEYYNRGTDND